MPSLLDVQVVPALHTVEIVTPSLQSLSFQLPHLIIVECAGYDSGRTSNIVPPINTPTPHKFSVSVVLERNKHRTRSR